MSEYKAKDMTNTEDFANLLEKSFGIQDKIDEMRNVKLDGTAKATVEAYEIGSRSAMELINKTAGDKLLNYTKSMADNSEKSLLTIIYSTKNLLNLLYINSSTIASTRIPFSVYFSEIRVAFVLISLDNPACANGIRSLTFFIRTGKLSSIAFNSLSMPVPFFALINTEFETLGA